VIFLYVVMNFCSWCGLIDLVLDLNSFSAFLRILISIIVDEAYFLFCIIFVAGCAFEKKTFRFSMTKDAMLLTEFIRKEYVTACGTSCAPGQSTFEVHNH